MSDSIELPKQKKRPATTYGKRGRAATVPGGLSRSISGLENQEKRVKLNDVDDDGMVTAGETALRFTRAESLPNSTSTSLSTKNQENLHRRIPSLIVTHPTISPPPSKRKHDLVDTSIDPITGTPSQSRSPLRFTQLIGNMIGSDEIGGTGNLAKKKKTMILGKKGEGRRTSVASPQVNLLEAGEDEVPAILSSPKSTSPKTLPFGPAGIKTFEQEPITVGRVMNSSPRVLGDKSNLSRSSQNQRFALHSTQIGNHGRSSPSTTEDFAAFRSLSSIKLQTVKAGGTPNKIIAYRDPIPPPPTATIKDFEPIIISPARSLLAPESNSTDSPPVEKSPRAGVDLQQGDDQELPPPNDLEVDDENIEVDQSERHSSILLETYEIDEADADRNFKELAEINFVKEVEGLSIDEDEGDPQISSPPIEKENSEKDVELAIESGGEDEGDSTIIPEEINVSQETVVEKVIQDDEELVMEEKEISEKSVESDEAAESTMFEAQGDVEMASLHQEEEKVIEEVELVKQIGSIDSQELQEQSEEVVADVSDVIEPEDNISQSINAELESQFEEESTQLANKVGQQHPANQKQERRVHVQISPPPAEPVEEEKEVESESDSEESIPDQLRRTPRIGVESPDSPLSTGPPSSEDDLAYFIRTNFALSDRYPDGFRNVYPSAGPDQRMIDYEDESSQGDDEKFGRRGFDFGENGNIILQSAEEDVSNSDGLSITWSNSDATE